MIAKDQLVPLQLLLQGKALFSLHLQGVFSKPQCPDLDQPKKAYTFLKRIKRQSFALKLAIYNKNLNMLKFLLNGESDEQQSGPKQTSSASELVSQGQQGDSYGAGLIS